MSDPIVSVTQGKLLGKVSKNINGENFYSFQGIPYAQSPVGPLRFKPPQPSLPWSGIRDATKEGHECYSRNLLLGKLVGSEDCLSLNIYTPQIENNITSPLKPVMVWIHGGAFTQGSNKTDIYGPEILLTEDIVLVTINYRLGILGFLNFEDSSLGIHGNAAMKDMVMALKWIQENISNFGGDNKNVTIFGESAGAAAVHYLVLSPITKGLFHRAIAQSGSALNVWARGRNISTELAKALELPTVDEKEILQRLMELPIEKLFEISEKVIDLCDMSTNALGKRPYAPVVEKPHAEAFLTEEPISILKSGNYNQVPLLFGYTTREGMLIEIKIRPRKPEMPRNFENLIPFMLEVERGSEEAKIIANKMKQFYYGNPGSEKNVDNFYLLHTDNYFVRDIMYAVKYHAATSTAPVYLFRMSIETSLNLFKNFGKITAPGVAHGDDLGYLFKTRFLPEIQPGSLEETSVKRFVKFWTNFAKYGSPNSNTEINPVHWQPAKKDQIHFIDIGEKLTTGVNPEHDRIEFWNNIFSLKNKTNM